jgi:Zn-finger nucleic acid-binding protein
LTTKTPTAVRCLVACRTCKRQFDATGLAAKSQFHCSCGEIIEVPRFQPHDSAVARCSSCSAPRTKGKLSCQHCGSDYTLHERDMHTICPSCMTRVSDRARFCHHCATPIVPQSGVGQTTTRPCPVCGVQHKMTSRSFGEPAVSVMECQRCAGLWLSTETFGLISEHARDKSLPDVFPAEDGQPVSTSNPGGGSLYRRCPECEKHMNRRNFGRKSGVIIDSCKEHGLWFDAQELGAILHWIRRGGEDRAERRGLEERRQAQRRQRIVYDREQRSAGSEGFSWSSEPTGGSGLGDLLGALFDL